MAITLHATRSGPGPGLALLLVLVTGVPLAGCAHQEGPAAAPTVVAAASPSASDEVDDPPGTVACHRLVAAVKDATLMEPGVVDAIVAAATAAGTRVADSAHRLAAAYAAAVAATDDGEPDAIAGVSAAGADMSVVCADSGLETVG
jgi:hypothetical protein